MAGTQSLDPRMAKSRPYELSGKEKAIAAARDMQATIGREVKRSGLIYPQYEFVELIGKGAFGRVFKSKYTPTGQLVAIKIIDIDAADFSSKGDDTAKDVLRETAALRALKESHAKNINVIHDAFFLASYVWIVSEYCPGGSVHTLMRASPTPGLSEAYIIPIARELAEALKWVHGAGIIHRDIKAANVLISEDGRVQLCDFGVAGVLESKINKRSTILGTPHYMPPEMLDVVTSNRVVHYGTEVDIWAFGCTLYELATGLPPNSRVAHEHLRYVVREQVPRLDTGKYSAGLCELMAFCVEESPSDRPSIEKVQNHHYIFNTARRHPTNSLKRLLYDYYLWERSGGQRVSLFMPGGAPVSEPSKEEDDEEEWNFSTTDDFDMSFAPAQSARRAESLSSTSVREHNSQGQNRHVVQPTETHRRIPLKPLERLFIADDSYNYLERGQQANVMAPSDLPLREHNEHSTHRETLIDAGDYDPNTGIATIPDMSTIRANMKLNRFVSDAEDEGEETIKFQETDEGVGRRATKDWKFPTFFAVSDEEQDRRKTQDWKFPTMIPTEEDDMANSSNPQASGTTTAPRPSLLHSATEPVGSSFVMHAKQADILTASSHQSIIYLDDPTPTAPVYGGLGADYQSSLVGSADFNNSFQPQPHIGLPELEAAGPHLGGPLNVDQKSSVPEGSNLADFMDSYGGNTYSDSAELDGMAIDQRQAQNFRLHFDRQQWVDWKDREASNVQTQIVEYPAREGILGRSNGGDFAFEDPGARQARPVLRLDDTDFPVMDDMRDELYAMGGSRSHEDELALARSQKRPAVHDPSPYMMDDSQPHSTKGRIGGSSAEYHGRTLSGASDGNVYVDEEATVEEPRQVPFRIPPLPAPPLPEVLVEGAPPELVAAELERMLTHFMDGLGATRTILEAHLDRFERRAAQKAAKKANKKAAKAAKRVAGQEVAEDTGPSMDYEEELLADPQADPGQNEAGEVVTETAEKAAEA